MKNTIVSLSILFLLLSFVSCSKENKNMEKLTAFLDSVKTEFAPDKRVSIFNYSVEKSPGNFILKIETNHPEAIEKVNVFIENQKLALEKKFDILPTDDLKGNTWGIVNVSVANIRSKPKHSAELATQALLGTVVKIYKKKNGWYLIQTPDEYISWVDDEGIIPVSEKDKNNYLKLKKVIFVNDYGFTYTKPSTKSFRVSDLVIGDLLEYDGTSGNFIKVKYPDGRKGYVPAKDVEVFSEWLGKRKPTQKNIVETAKRFHGIPYLWGGTSAKAYDCSGFTKTVYFMNGVILPRDASQQALVGEFVDDKINLDKFQLGDLVFFGRKAKNGNKAKVTHVGIYIGNGKYIHEAGKVKINSFVKTDEDFNQYRYNAFLWAQRILSSIERNGVKLIKTNNYYRKVK